MSISKDEQLLTMAEATKLLPRVNGKRIHTSTIWRWMRKGSKGIFLEYVRIGSKIATSPDALNRFFVSVADTDKAKQFCGDVSWPRQHRHLTDKARQRSIEEARNILRKAKIIV